MWGGRPRLQRVSRPADRVQFWTVAHRKGIARNIQLDRTEAEHLNIALEESLVPEFEWNRLTEVLGLELLSRLVGTSSSSVRSYKAAAKTTPDDAAERVHFLSLIVGDLTGAYNEIGIRQWFERKREIYGMIPVVYLNQKLFTEPNRARRLLRSIARKSE